MFVSKAEYRVKAEFARRNLDNINGFLSAARERLKPESSYSVSIAEDGRTFLHLFTHKDGAEVAMLGDIPAFHHFLKEVMEGCDIPPNMTTFTEI